MQYQQAYAFLTSKLETELPAELSFHNVGHTKHVVESVTYLAREETISGEELVLLQTAALFHDSGFLQDYEHHEEVSCSLARTHLPRFGYSDKQVETICRLIMATRLPQTPLDHLAMILCDADLYYLGTDQYEENAEHLFKELKAKELIGSREDWIQRQHEFLTTHHFFTPTAIREKREDKQLVSDKIKALHQANTTLKKKVNFVNTMQDAFLIVFGVISTGFALKGFLVPNRFFDGGVTGLSLLLHELYHFNLAFTIVLANLPLIVISYFSVNRHFAFKTFVCVLLLGICLLYFPYPDSLTSDKLLISIFGGVFLGIGIGLAMRAGCALDGVEVFALYTLKRTSFTITEIILGINILIFAIAAFKFGVETALYSILTYFTASRCIDYVVEGIQAYTGVTIISGQSETIKDKLVNELGRGITVYNGKRGFLPGNFETSTDCEIIFTVITRLEMRRLKNLVYSVDPKAFVFASTIKEAAGGILKRRHGH